MRRGLGRGVLSLLLASLWLPGAEGVEQAGTFQGEGVACSVKDYVAGFGGDLPAERSPEYTVRVFFATPARSLLANVGLVVRDAQGRVVFRIDQAEPIIYLGLPRGIYTFEGSYHGATPPLCL